MFTDAPLAPTDIANEYFRVWREYDYSGLQNLFYATATYEIRGKRTLKGYKEIRDYWARNQHRQKDLILSWKFLNWDASRITVSFNARFFDTEEKQYQQILGQIE